MRVFAPPIVSILIVHPAPVTVPTFLQRWHFLPMYLAYLVRCVRGDHPATLPFELPIAYLAATSGLLKHYSMRKAE
jgi:hypothetical protein